MSASKHGFTEKIVQIVNEKTGLDGEKALKKSPLLNYLNIKTKAADKGSKSRASFANHYALYVLIEDYISHGFDDDHDYADYEGA